MAASAKNPPNIVLVTVDALRHDRVGRLVDGKSLTPTIDALARHGIVFENLFSQAVETPVAHSAIFSGRFPRLDGWRLSHKKFTGDEMRLPLWLKRAGYSTAGFISAYALDRNRGFDRGFDTYGDCLRENDPLYFFHRGHMLFVFEVLKRMPLSRFQKMDLGKRRFSHETLAAAFSWLEKAPRHKPYFLFCHLFDTHCEYYSPQGFRKYEVRSNKKTLREFETGKRTLTGDARQQIQQQYDLAVRYVDSQLETLLQALRARADDRDTLVVITADHGEGLGDHGYMLHGCELYDEEVHVPGVIASLQQRLTPKKIQRLVRSIDLAPTLLRLSGHAQFPCDGKAVAELFDQDENYRDRLSFTESRHTYLEAKWLRALRTQSHKYIYDSNGREELYELDSDPLETENIIGRERSLSHELLRRQRAEARIT